MRVIGVDPGTNGACALLGPDGIEALADMPAMANEVDAWGLTRLLSEWGQVDRVFVEAVAAFPRNGSIGNFKLGRALGVVQGVLAVLERPVAYVRATTWTKHHRVGSDKAAHRRRASELWPEWSESFARVKDADRADACLIAEYGRNSLFLGQHSEVNQ